MKARTFMPFNVVISISEDSKRGQVIRKLAEEQHSSPEQVVERIIEEGMESQARRGNVPVKNRSVRRGPRRPARNREAEPIIGMFADKDGFCESIAAVIASRAQRYGGRS